MTGLSWLNVLAGIWLIIAPWILGYQTLGAKINDVVLGVIITVVALIVALAPLQTAPD